MLIALTALAAFTQTGGLEISHRDVGAAVPPGVASPRRCLWTATAPDGTRLEGSRPGDCARNRRAIAEEVARAADRRTNARVAPETPALRR